eukprot:3240690-Amphidinium_carterae.1
MSATVNSAIFSEYFSEHVEGLQQHAFKPVPPLSNRTPREVSVQSAAAMMPLRNENLGSIKTYVMIACDCHPLPNME